MKKLALVLLFLTQTSWGVRAFASTSQEYGFKYNTAREVFEIKIKATSHAQAYELAAQECFNHFAGVTGRGKVQLSEDRGLDIIDICANPRKI